jgi:glycosyltransferase A (GT-A) superfamily protein (DUF2064 family)
MEKRIEEGKRTVLAVYCRRPETKRVKTRLASTIGANAARIFYAGCLDSLRQDLQILRRKFDIAICPSDEKDEDWARNFFSIHDMVIPQIYGNLGLRIEHTDLVLRCKGYEKVVIIGSDSPSLPIGYLEDVDDFLTRADVVFGPCVDGGVYAIGSRITLLPLKDIPWGTKAVFTRLKEKFQREGIKVGTPPTWYDVDRAEDLDRVRDDLIRSSMEHRQALGHLVDEILEHDSIHGKDYFWLTDSGNGKSLCKKSGGEA